MTKKTLLLGITLFSMFFGAGNLIFAPYLGAKSASDAWLALAGMLTTSVLMPVLAIVIIAPYQTANNMISRIWKPLGPIFMTLVYLLIGPCIAIPRTASTALEMWTWLVQGQWATILWIVLFFSMALIMAIRPGKLKDILGKVMGPILIVLILLVCIPLLFNEPQVVAAGGIYASNPFFTGLNEGYQTMDILAAFCFGIIIVMNIKKLEIKKEKQTLALSAIIAGTLLASLYILLAFTASQNSGIFQPLSNGAQILSLAASMTYGSFGQILCGLIFLIACLNVCSGLLACCSEYFHEHFPVLSYFQWLMLFTIAGAITACTGLDSILSWSGTLLSYICPLSLVLLVFGVFFSIKDRRFQTK